MEREAQVLDLRRDGMSFRQIARELGYASASGAHQAWQRAMAEHLPKTLVAEERAKMLDALDADEAKCWAIFDRFHPVVSGGEIVRGLDGEPLDDDGPKLAAIDRVGRIRERRARLLGLDAPTRARLEVVGENALDELIATYEAELATIDVESRIAG